MKKFLRLTSFLLTFAAVVTILSSCEMMSNINLTDAESSNTLLRKKLEKHIDPESVIFNLYLGSASDFSVKMDIVSVVFMAPGSDEIKTYAITVAGNQDPRETKTISSYQKRTRESGILLKDMDFSKIASNVNEAAGILAEEDMPFDGVGGYHIEIDGDLANTIHKFSLQSKEGTELGTKGNKAAIVTNYYELDFVADAEGNVEYVE